MIKNIGLILSVLLNLVILLVIQFHYKGYDEQKVIVKGNENRIDYEITSTNNFESVFIEKNDSIYKMLWNEAFENQPQSAFLISCSYFFVTKEHRILNDIESSRSQLEIVYAKNIIIPNDSSRRD